MSEGYVAYRRLEMAWAIAREQAGGQLSTDEEVMWTERIADVWRRLSWEEQELIEQPAPLCRNLSFVDRKNQIGESARERDAA